MDLSDLDYLVTAQEAGVDIDILHPVTREPIGFIIRVAGLDSARVKDAQRKFLDRRLAKRRSSKITAADLEKEATLALAAAVISWTSVEADGTTTSTALLDGERLECTRSNAVALFERFPWLKEQVDAVVQDRADFFEEQS